MSMVPLPSVQSPQFYWDPSCQPTSHHQQLEQGHQLRDQMQIQQAQQSAWSQPAYQMYQHQPTVSCDPSQLPNINNIMIKTEDNEAHYFKPPTLFDAKTSSDDYQPMGDYYNHSNVLPSDDTESGYPIGPVSYSVAANPALMHYYDMHNMPIYQTDYDTTMTTTVSTSVVAPVPLTALYSTPSAYSPPPQDPLVSKPTKKRIPAVPCHSNSICANCKTKVTTLWRRNHVGEIECNACNLYFRKNQRKRPQSLRKDGILKRNRKPRCESPHTRPGSSQARS